MFRLCTYVQGLVTYKTEGEYMVDGITLAVIGFGIGITSLVIAVYSVIKQKKLETRLKEKEKLKELSKHLEKRIIPITNRIVDVIKDPTNDEDLFFQLQMLSQEVVSKAFDENVDTIHLTTEITVDIKEKNNLTKQKEKKKVKNVDISAENKRNVIKYLEDGRLDFIIIQCTLGDSYTYTVSDFLLYIQYLFSNLDNLEKDFGKLIDEFRPDIIKNLKDCLKEVFLIVLDSATISKEIEVNTKSFNKTNDIGLWIYSRVNGIDKLTPYLDKLTESKIKFEKFRETLIMTSYT